MKLVWWARLSPGMSSPAPHLCSARVGRGVNLRMTSPEGGGGVGYPFMPFPKRTECAECHEPYPDDMPSPRPLTCLLCSLRAFTESQVELQAMKANAKAHRDALRAAEKAKRTGGGFATRAPGD